MIDVNFIKIEQGRFFTDNEVLQRRMDERMDQVYFQQWLGRDMAPSQVRPMSVSGPDDRLLHGKYAFWNPWQDAIAAVGFGAQHRMTGNRHARALAEAESALPSRASSRMETAWRGPTLSWAP